jgi:hypothetical protein
LGNLSDTENKLPETEHEEEGLSVNSIAYEQNVAHRKIQLWTNKHQNQFAIKLTPDSETPTVSDDYDDSNIFLAATNHNQDYVRVIAETDYFEPLKHGWDYTLGLLIEQHKRETTTISLRKITSTNNNNDKVNNIRTEENNNSNTIPIRLHITNTHYCGFSL